jgi:AcrR family transcriptional regulator
VTERTTGSRGGGSRRRLGPDDWTSAALTVIGEAGVAAVAVESLAARLGATKGSFYWHFANRDALVEAALRRWEAERTEAVIALMDTEPVPRLRLTRLFSLAMQGGRGDAVEPALLASASDPVVGQAVSRVTRRRIAYVTQIFSELGLPIAEARSRALLAFTAHLGMMQMRHNGSSAVPADAQAWEDYIDRVVELLLQGTAEP